MPSHARISTAALICSQSLLRETNVLFQSFKRRLCRTGRIDSQEIQQSLRDLGVHISEEQAEKILKR